MDSRKPLSIKATCYTKGYGKHIIPIEVTNGSLPESLHVRVNVSDDELRKFDPRKHDWNAWAKEEIDPTHMSIRCDHFEGTIYFDSELKFMKKFRNPIKVSKREDFIGGSGGAGGIASFITDSMKWVQVCNS